MDSMLNTSSGLYVFVCLNMKLGPFILQIHFRIDRFYKTTFSTYWFIGLSWIMFIVCCSCSLYIALVFSRLSVHGIVEIHRSLIVIQVFPG